MSHTNQFLIAHGLPIVFGAVILEQLGLPLPAAPVLMAAGALSTAGEFNLPLGIVLAIIACLIADALWFYLGKYRGNQVLNFLCRISLEPDTCVRRTLNVFTRYGMRGVVVAKFLPGMSTVTPPLAGMNRISAGRFFFFDGVGSLLYCGSFFLVGCLFSNQLTQIGEAMSHIGSSALTLFGAFAVLYIAYKYWQRQRLLHELRMARITVDELHQKVDDGENPVILDLRSKEELELDPSIISGAIHLGVDDVAKRQHEFPHDRDIIVYCACPNEVSSARVALSLHRQGFTRVRPLLGGIDAWRKNNYPMGVWTTTTTVTSSNVLTSQTPATVDVTFDPASTGGENHTPKARKEESA